MSHVASNTQSLLTRRKASSDSSDAGTTEMSWASKFKKRNTEEMISDVIAISKIAVKTGLAPNILIAIYPSQDGSKKCDLSKMSQDLGEKGKEVILQRAKDFEESKVNGRKSFLDKYYPNGIEMGEGSRVAAR